MFQATTIPPAPQIRWGREAGNNVVGGPGGKSRNTHFSQLVPAVPNVTGLESVASPHSFERKQGGWLPEVRNTFATNRPDDKLVECG
jgi:hypothetical protein